MTRPGDGIHTELLEAAYQELWFWLTHRFHTDLPEPVLIAARVRRYPLRKEMGSHRVGAGRKSTRRQGALT